VAKIFKSNKPNKVLEKNDCSCIIWYTASRGDYLIPRSYTTTKQNRGFSAAGLSIWNGLPFELRSLPRDFSSSFYSLLKAFLFAQDWAGSASE